MTLCVTLGLNRLFYKDGPTSTVSKLQICDHWTPVIPSKGSRHDKGYRISSFLRNCLKMYKTQTWQIKVQRGPIVLLTEGQWMSGATMFTHNLALKNRQHMLLIWHEETVETAISVTDQTVWRALHDANLCAWHPSRKPPYTEQHKTVMIYLWALLFTPLHLLSPLLLFLSKLCLYGLCHLTYSICPPVGPRLPFCLHIHLLTCFLFPITWASLPTHTPVPSFLITSVGI